MLEIEPAKSPDDIIKLRITRAHLSSATLFDALSYAWGDQSIKLSILINGEPFEVGENLHAALKALRANGRNDFLWIDAICINQSDIPERNSQLSLMTQIYSLARTVICWLGEPGDDSELAISTLNECKEDLTNARYLGFCEPSHPSWNAIEKFIRRPYWTRTWVIQENFVARQRVFMCGDKEIMGSDMFTVFDALSLSLRVRELAVAGFPKRPASQAAKNVRDFDFFNQRIPSILGESRQQGAQLIELLNALLMETSKFETTDPRDRLYGILGLMPRDIYQLVKPDYKQSIKTVFTNFALNLYEEWFGMIAQSGIGHTQSQQQQTRCPDMPSWIPTYRGQFFNNQQFRIKKNGSESHNFNAGGNIRPQWDLVTGTLTLRVSGILKDNIVTISPPETTLGARIATWSYWAATTICNDHPCGNWRRAFYHTLLLDQDRSKVVGYEGPDRVPVHKQHGVSLEQEYLSLMQSAFKHFPHENRAHVAQRHSVDGAKQRSLRLECEYWLEDNTSVQIRDLRDGKELRPSVVMPLLDEGSIGVRIPLIKALFPDFLDRMTEARSFIVTESGYIGLAPVGTQIGDQVALIPGCPVPLVLRREDSRFQVLGDSYIYGLMEGQAFESTNTGFTNLEDLLLV